MQLFDSDGNFIMSARTCKKPKFAGNGRSWDSIIKIIDGIEVEVNFDSTWGRNLYFEFNDKWYYSPIIRKDYSDGISQHKEKLYTKEGLKK